MLYMPRENEPGKYIPFGSAYAYGIDAKRVLAEGLENQMIGNICIL